jgi:hypothetical protein
MFSWQRLPPFKKQLFDTNFGVLKFQQIETWCFFCFFGFSGSQSLDWDKESLRRLYSVRRGRGIGASRTWNSLEGLPSKYYPGPMLLNFSVRMGTGVSITLGTSKSMVLLASWHNTKIISICITFKFLFNAASSLKWWWDNLSAASFTSLH